jgi:hypothetical protein
MRFTHLLGVVCVVSNNLVVYAAKNGMRGDWHRELVQGGNGQVPCEPDDSGSCQWGVNGGADVKRFWVEHPNVFWRCHKPGLIALTYDDG